MSHITRIVKTQIRDLDALLKALSDIGYTKVEVHDKPRRINISIDTAGFGEVIVRRSRFGIFPNNFGFARRRDGTFSLICGRTEDRNIIGELMQRYIYHVTKAKLEAQGFTLVADEVQAGDRLHLVLRRTV